MGVIELVALAVTAATGIKQAAQARKAARAQREASEISTASQQIQDRAERRKALREARIRRAIIENSAVQSGAEGSSGEFGATSALQSNVGASIANQTSQSLASRGITRQNQIAAEAESRFDQIGAFGGLVNQGLDLWGEYKKGKTG